MKATAVVCGGTPVVWPAVVTRAESKEAKVEVTGERERTGQGFAKEEG